MRRHDLDWLRIAAFGLLIGYHVGMLYVPWQFHVKSAYRGGPVLTALMLALNPWRLSLLFLISGAATGYMMRGLGRGALARQRAWRLAVPMLFGMLVVVVPQVYFEVVDAGKYDGGFLAFWGRYLRGDQSFQTPIPTWNHLWFVVYLLVYTLLVAAFWPRSRNDAAPRDEADTVPSRALLAALLLGPWVLQWVLRMTLFPRFGSNHALIADWYNHALFFGMFAFGLLLARRPVWWRAIDRLRWPALAMAVLGGAVFITLAVGYPAGASADAGYVALTRVAREAQAWGAVLAALGFAQRHLNHDHRWRAYLVDAVFAYYIVHQTALIALAMWLKPLRLGGGLEAGLVIGGTALACGVTAEVARRVGWLRPLFGFRARPVAGA